MTTGRQDLAAGRRHLATGWAAVTGTGGAASLTLALLVGVCVFVAIAGPRESLGLRTQALRATLAGQSRLAKSVDAGSSYSDFADSHALGGGAFPPGDVSLVRTELAGRLARRGLPLAPAAQAWSGLTTQYEPVTGAGRSAINGAVLPKLEVIYRDALRRNSRLVAGQLPATGTATALQIAVTAATAARFGLHPGSRLGAGLSASSAGRSAWSSRA